MASFWKYEACSQTVLPDRSLFIGQKRWKMPKLKKLNATFLVIFKRCESFQNCLLYSIQYFGRTCFLARNWNKTIYGQNIYFLRQCAYGYEIWDGPSNFSIFNQETIVNENQLVEMMMVHVKLPRFSQGVIINFDRFIQKKTKTIFRVKRGHHFKV